MTEPKKPSELATKAKEAIITLRDENTQLKAKLSELEKTIVVLNSRTPLISDDETDRTALILARRLELVQSQYTKLRAWADDAQNVLKKSRKVSK